MNVREGTQKRGKRWRKEQGTVLGEEGKREKVKQKEKEWTEEREERRKHGKKTDMPEIYTPIKG